MADQAGRQAWQIRKACSMHGRAGTQACIKFSAGRMGREVWAEQAGREG
jgi:hypothetical protein